MKINACFFSTYFGKQGPGLLLRILPGRETGNDQWEWPIHTWPTNCPHGSFLNERFPGNLITPAADSSNNLSNNSLVAAQENSSHCENQLELALIDEPYVEGQSTDSGSTAKSTQAGSDNTMQ